MAVTWLLHACCTSPSVAEQARLRVKELECLCQKITTNVLLFKENIPLYYSSILNQSVSKKSRQVENLVVIQSQHKQCTPKADVLIDLPPTSKPENPFWKWTYQSSEDRNKYKAILLPKFYEVTRYSPEKQFCKS